MSVTIKMPAEFKAQWIAALRSGEYRQTDGYLQAEMFGGGTGYCCLGVMQMAKCGHVEGDIVEMSDDESRLDANSLPTAGWLRRHGIEVISNFAGDVSDDAEVSPALPVAVFSDAERQEFGFPSENLNGFIPFDEMNDAMNLTFNQIADFIEKYVETI
jgi:hypothetical protein